MTRHNEQRTTHARGGHDRVRVFPKGGNKNPVWVGHIK